MKKRISFFEFSLMAFVAILTLYACSGDPQKKGPRETAEAFLQAMQYGDYDAAKQYCSEGTAKNLDLMKTMATFGGPNKLDAFTITNVQEDGDYATVKYDQGDTKDKLLQLRKSEERWEVLLSKSDLDTDDDKKDDKETVVTETETPKETEEEIDNKYKSFREGKTSRQVAEAFFAALGHNDYTAAKRYGSSTTNDVLEMQESMAQLDKDKKPLSRTITRVEEDGEYANVYYKENGEKLEKVLKMGKDSNGLWVVMMTKSDFESDKD